MVVILNNMHENLYIEIPIATNVADNNLIERGFPHATMSIDDFRDKYSNEIKNNELHWCKYCEWYVDRNAKHCRKCNRCTIKFDHHCKWFNNCVSQLNYKYFFTCVCFIETRLCLEIVTIGILISNENKHANIKSHVLFENLTFLILLLFSILHLVVCCILIIFVTQLLTFHIYLIYRGISTYDWIIDTRDKKIEKQNNVNMSAKHQKKCDINCCCSRTRKNKYSTDQSQKFDKNKEKRTTNYNETKTVKFKRQQQQSDDNDNTRKINPSDSKSTIANIDIQMTTTTTDYDTTTVMTRSPEMSNNSKTMDQFKSLFGKLYFVCARQKTNSDGGGKEIVVQPARHSV